MNSNLSVNDVEHALIEWGRIPPVIRAMLITSTRARSDTTVDQLSD